MNLILFGLVLILFHLSAPSEDPTFFSDILPDFAGYLLLWFALEKRRINARMRGVYTAVSVMIPISFLVFLSQIQANFNLFETDDFRETFTVILSSLLTWIYALSARWSGILSLIAAGILLWFFFAILGHWDERQEDYRNRLICRVGMGLCAVTGVLYLVSAIFPNLPFSVLWITYPLSAAAIGAAWLATKDYSDMQTGIRNND